MKKVVSVPICSDHKENMIDQLLIQLKELGFTLDNNSQFSLTNYFTFDLDYHKAHKAAIECHKILGQIHQDAKSDSFKNSIKQRQSELRDVIQCYVQLNVQKTCILDAVKNLDDDHPIRNLLKTLVVTQKKVTQKNTEQNDRKVIHYQFCFPIAKVERSVFDQTPIEILESLDKRIPNFLDLRQMIAYAPQLVDRMQAQFTLHKKLDDLFQEIDQLQKEKPTNNPCFYAPLFTNLKIQLYMEVKRFDARLNNFILLPSIDLAIEIERKSLFLKHQVENLKQGFQIV